MPVFQGGTNLFRDLEQRLPQLLAPRRRELPFESGVFVPTKPDLAPGSYEVVKTVINDVGSATILGDGAFDFPVVDASASEDRYRNLMAVAGFTIGYQTSRREAYAASIDTLRVSQYDMKMQTCIRAIQERRNRIAAIGDATIGATGLLNNANIVADNNSFNPYLATADDLIDFFISQVESFYTNSNNVFFPTTALVSDQLDFKMIRSRVPNSELTVKEYIQNALKKRGLGFKIEGVKEAGFAQLEAAGVLTPGTNKDRIVLYPLDPEVVERHVEMIQMAPLQYLQVQGLNTLYPMFGCMTPTIINYTNAISYIDVIKKP